MMIRTSKSAGRYNVVKWATCLK